MKIQKLEQLKHKYNINDLSERDWTDICVEENLSEEFIEFYHAFVDWLQVSKHQELSENFMRRNKEQLFWTSICSCQELSEEFMEEQEEYIFWNRVWANQIFSIEFFNKYFEPEHTVHLLKNPYVTKGEFSKYNIDMLLKMKGIDVDKL